MSWLRRAPDPLESVNLLELAPVRIAPWREVEGRVVVERPRPLGRGLRAGLERVSYHLAPRLIRLDDVGGFAWKRLDGGVSVGQVARAVREKFGETAEPVEERVGLFVRLLRRERLLAYPGWDCVERR